MAEYDFTALSVRASLKEQSIFVDFSLDIDEDTISAEKIYLLNQDTQSIAPIKIIVDGRTLQLKLLDWAVPNSKYTLIIESGIGSISEEVIDVSLLKDVTFESEVVSEITLINPYNYQIYRDTIKLVWNEVTAGSRVNSYYVEIADDVGFHNVVIKTFIDLNGDVSDKIDDVYKYKTSLAPLKEYGQYYIRLRAQDTNDAYGKWSDVITFDFLEPVKKSESSSTDSSKEDSSTATDTTTDDNKKDDSSTSTETQPNTPTDESDNESADPGDVNDKKSDDELDSDTDSYDDSDDDDEENEGETIVIEDMTGTGSKTIILDTNDVTLEYEDVLDLLPEYFSIYYPVDIDISNAEFTIVRRDI